MAFTPPDAQVPTTIPRLTIHLSDRLAEGEEPASQTADYQLVLLDQNGRRIPFAKDTGNLVPHLTSGEITQLQDFMTTLRARAEAQIIGT